MPYPAGGYGAGLLKVFLSSPLGLVTCLIGLPMWCGPGGRRPFQTSNCGQRVTPEDFSVSCLGGLEVVIVPKPLKTICLLVNN